jgi:hypothetical protein
VRKEISRGGVSNSENLDKLVNNNWPWSDDVKQQKFLCSQGHVSGTKVPLSYQPILI